MVSLTKNRNNGWNLLAILDSQSSILQSFLWGLDLSGTPQGAGGVGGLLAVSDAAMGTHFTCYDGNGNITALVKASDGTESADYEYSPFGQVLRATGTMAETNVFRFSTKYQDDESDFLYYGYRSYNPNTGRWLNRDPLGDLLDQSHAIGSEDGSDIDIEYGFTIEESLSDFIGLNLKVANNLYAFAENGPINRYDILGLVSPTCEIVSGPTKSRCLNSKREKIGGRWPFTLYRLYCIRAVCYYRCRCPNDNCHCSDITCTKHGTEYGPVYVTGGTSAKPANCQPADQFAATKTCP